MESKDIKPLMKRYFQEISALYHRGDSPGNIAYCRVLKDLLNQTLKCFPGNFTRYNVVIDILEIPPELQIQMPCMRLWDGKAEIYGYIDVLGPGTTTKNIKEYPWLVKNWPVPKTNCGSKLLARCFEPLLRAKNQELRAKPKGFPANGSPKAK